MKYVILLFGCLLLVFGTTMSQELIITDFPLGVAGSVSADFFKPYYDNLKTIADSLHQYPLARAIITGSADGEQYRENNDAKNPGLALGRAHILRDFLINEFKINPDQLIIQSEDVKNMGGQYRQSTIRINMEISDLESRLDALEKRPPVEKHFTEVQEIKNELKESLKLHFGLGLSSSPFGGIPVLTGGLSWKEIAHIEGIFGHTFWNNDFRFNNTDLETKNRLIGLNLIFYPFDNLPVGILGGWIRIEQMSLEYYEYVRMSEGPVLGLRAEPYKFISITGAYNPSKQRIAGGQTSMTDNDQFLIYVTARWTIGGEK